MFVCLPVLGGYIYATTGVTFRIDPKARHIIVRPGTELDTQVSVQNIGDPAYVSFDIQADSPIEAKFTQGTGQTPITRTDPVLFESETKRSFTLSLKVPKNIPSKDYKVRFVTKPTELASQVDGKATLQFAPYINSQVTLSVTPDGVLDMRPKVALFSNPAGKLVLSSDDQQIFLLVQNLGEHQTYVTGTVDVTYPDGSTHTKTVTSSALPAHGQAYLKTEKNADSALLTLPQSELLSGQYSLAAKLQVPGQDTPQVYAQTNFYVISTPLMIIIMVLILGLFGSIFFIAIRHFHVKSWKMVTIHRSSTSSTQ